MKRISRERKAATLAKLLRPYNMTVAAVAQMEGISEANAYAESLFRTLKYVPKWPSSGFRTLSEARQWVETFTRWYNEEHRHSGIQYVTPGQRHRGEDNALLRQQDELYRTAQKAHPERWSGRTRNWQPEGPVTLNRERTKQAA